MNREPESKTTNINVACECQESGQNFLWLATVLESQLDDWEVKLYPNEVFCIKSKISRGLPFMEVNGEFSYWKDLVKFTLPDAEYALSLLACYASASLGERDTAYRSKVNAIHRCLLDSLELRDKSSFSEFMEFFLDKV